MDTLLGKYRLDAELGRGGMGIVYLAFDTVLERPVALKTIISDQKDTSLRQRFLREARAAGKLRHNNIVTVYDFGVEDDKMYIVMEYLEGRDLGELIAQRPRMDIKEKLEIVRQVCMALEFAHENGIFHRDIKPANVQVLNDGVVKIVDFGLAIMQSSSLTGSSAFLGTPNYTAPERLKGQPADSRTDQFSVGLILYELLTYTRPFKADTISTVIYQILHCDPPEMDPTFTGNYPELAAIIKRSIMKETEDRYPSMRALEEDLAALLDKMNSQDFSLSQPIPIQGEADVPTDQMETIQVSRKKSRPNLTTDREGGKKALTPTGMFAAAAVLAVLAVILYFTLFQKGGTVPTGPPGYLSFDVKPYAFIDEVIHQETGENIVLKETELTTPVRLSLPPGRYKIVYSPPQWTGEKRTKIVTVSQGQTVVEKDWTDEEFTSEAVKHFSLPPEAGTPPPAG